MRPGRTPRPAGLRGLLRPPLAAALRLGGGAAVAAPFQGILDRLATPAAGAWSVARVLRTAWLEQPLIRLRRASDDAESDFGADENGLLDVASIATFLTATTGAGTAWKDQSGNDNHGTQATGASQPAYVASGINSLPSWSFVGGANGPRFNAANSATLENLFATGGTLVVVMAMETTADRIVSKNDSSGWAVVRNGGNPNFYLAHGTAQASARTNGMEFSTNAAALLIVTYDGGTSGNGVNFRKSGSATSRVTLNSGAGSQASDAVAGLTIGARFSGGANPFIGQMIEVMLFRELLAGDDLTTLEADIIGFYGL